MVDQPAQLKLITRDQHGRLAQCNAVAVEVCVFVCLGISKIRSTVNALVKKNANLSENQNRDPSDKIQLCFTPRSKESR